MVGLNRAHNPENSFEPISGPSTPDDLESTLEITEKDFIDFIGPNADKYMETFRKFNIRGVDQFSVTWHWPAFFVSFFWMLYRKLYLWALLVFLISYIPIAGFIMMIVYGLTGNYLYFRHAKKKIMEMKIRQSASDLSESLRDIGGVNQWVKTVAIVLFILAIMGILAAILIPFLVARSLQTFTFSIQ